MTIQFISAEEIIYFHDNCLALHRVTGMSDPGEQKRFCTGY